MGPTGATVSVTAWARFESAITGAPVFSLGPSNGRDVPPWRAPRTVGVVDAVPHVAPAAIGEMPADHRVRRGGFVGWIGAAADQHVRRPHRWVSLRKTRRMQAGLRRAMGRRGGFSVPRRRQRRRDAGRGIASLRRPGRRTDKRTDLSGPAADNAGGTPQPIVRPDDDRRIAPPAHPARLLGVGDLAHRPNPDRNRRAGDRRLTAGRTASGLVSRQ